MPIQRATLNTILDTPFVTVTPIPVRSGLRMVRTITPAEFSELCDTVRSAARTGKLKLSERWIEQVPENLPKLRIHPIVRAAKLEDKLELVARQKLSFEKFRLMLLTEMPERPGSQIFTSQDKLAVINYLQQEVLQPLIQTIEGGSPELAQAAEFMDGLVAMMYSEGLLDEQMLTEPEDNVVSSSTDTDTSSQRKRPLTETTPKNSPASEAEASAPKQPRLEERKRPFTETAPKISPASEASAPKRARQSIQKLELAQLLKNVGATPVDIQILFSSIRSFTPTILQQLSALYYGMSKTPERFRADECLLLMRQPNLINIERLKDPAFMEVTMAELREVLNILDENEQFVSGFHGMDWPEVFYNYFFNVLDDYKHPLVESVEECEELFTDLIKFNPSPERLGDHLKYFRKMQHYQDDAGVVFTNSMFPILVETRSLEKDPTEPSADFKLSDEDKALKAKGVDVYADRRREVLQTLMSHMMEFENFEPINTKDQIMLAKGLNPAGAGLVNYNNNCFMNGTLQAAACSWQVCGILDGMREKPSSYALYNMFDGIYEGQATGEQRREEVWKLVRRVQENPQSIEDPDMPTRAVAALKAHDALRKHFLALCDGLNSQTVKAKTLIKEQTDFVEAYSEYGAVCGRSRVADLLGCEQDQKVILGRIPQQDPEEFYSTLTEAMGIDCDPRYGVGTSSLLTLYRDGVAVDSRTNPMPFTSPRIAIPLAGETLQEAINNFGTEEVLEKDNQISWGDERLKELGFAQDERTKTTKKIVLIAREAPRQLTLSMNLFSNYDVSGQNLLSEARYMRTEGLKLLKRLERHVKVPIILQSEATAGASAGQEQSNGSQPVTVPYKVLSVVCHRGEALASGHYITLKLTGEDLVICDDDVVADLDTYARSHGQAAYKDWDDFCDHEQLTPYLVNMVRSEETTV